MACKVSVTINLDGEYFWLSQFPDSATKEKTLSMGTYGLLRGLERVLNVLEHYEIKGTFFVPGAIAQKYSDQVAQIAQKGHEVACHGMNHENMALIDVAAQKKAVLDACEVLERVCGKRPVGFRAPEGELTTETLEMLSQEGFLYSSSLYNEDVPYVTPYQGLIEIPIKWQLFDFPYFAFNYSPAFPAGQGRIAAYAKVLENMKFEYDGANRYNLSYILQLDPQTIGTPGRIGLLEELLEYIKCSGNAEILTCEALARQVRL